MRKSLLLGLLGLDLAAASMIHLTKSGATHASPQKGGGVGKSRPKTLPDFDIRLAGKSEFADYDLNTPAAAAKGAAQNSPLTKAGGFNHTSYYSTSRSIYRGTIRGAPIRRPRR